MAFNQLRVVGIGLLGTAMLLSTACSDDAAGEDATATPTASATQETPTTTTSSPSVIATVEDSRDSDASNTEPANPDSPPEGTIASTSGEVDLGLGTYCWSPPAASGNPAVCADAIGIVTAVADLPVTAGETLTIADEAPGTLPWPPLSIDNATLWPAPAEPVMSDADFRAWQPDGGYDGGLELETDSSEIGSHTVTLPADLAPGRYLLSVHYTAGPDRGSEATYGAVLVVE